jgi:hypothetical protein
VDLTQTISNTGALCSLGQSVFGSTYSFLWSVITFFGLWKCLLIIVGLAFWIAWEVSTKGTHSYNSENGFTPEFNRFIGASTYFGLQTIVYFVLEKFFSEAIYCLKWPYALHVLVFFLTGFILHVTGVWPYWKIFGGKVRL